ncbi:DUF2059 domain-containing protein [Massilia sp. CCM 9210]|uniref:DUF2059 domain-containing protein n=1 Tax=Massilia scottii TaxID=3057166 RepID=UPI0027963E65|nr:DUF2059 domain-containing protein [Massilia sp. CCM 9210]MDQ1817372.1 DUF2059 domain-containing protein [Massilia sp. CCM 9210]
MKPLHMPVIGAARSLARACMVALALSQPAWAEPATRESLGRYFSISKTERLSDSMAAAILEAAAPPWPDQTDTGKQAERKATHELMSAILRERAGWSVIEPGAVAIYQQHFQESEVQALIAQAQSPFGQTFIDKIAPAMRKRAPAVQAHIAERTAQFMTLNPDSTFTAVPLPLPRAGSKEALALAMMLEWPAARARFDANMARLETMAVEVTGADGVVQSAGQSEQSRRFARMLREQFKFEEIAAVEARVMASELDEADIAALIENNRNPERAAQRIKIELAETELAAHVHAYLQSIDLRGLATMAQRKEQTIEPATPEIAIKAHKPARTN